MPTQLPMMTVSGIRGQVPDVLTPYIIQAIAYIQTKIYGGNKVVVGRDTRPSGAILARAAFQGIRAAGGCPVDIGIAPTPTTCVAVQTLRACCGIILTASHNPLPYNGYKMVHPSGRLFSGDECDAVYAEFHKGNYPAQSLFDNQPNIAAETIDAIDLHIQTILSAVDVAMIKNAHLHIAVDAINGAANAILPRLCEKLGVMWTGINTGLDGNFVHNPEPRPEHLQELSQLLSQKSGFCGGFAFDPDADRLALMGEKGEPISEEMTLALGLENILERKSGPVATNLSTSMVIDDVAKKYGCTVFRTKIGEANVVEGMRAHNCIAGGEGNGGIIYPAISVVRDGPAALALICELMARKKTCLAQLAGKWPVYPIVKEKISSAGCNVQKTIAALAKRFSGEQVDLQDGLKIIRSYGWVHIRPSNTEPIVRCYAEAQSAAQARELADLITAEFNACKQ